VQLESWVLSSFGPVVDRGIQHPSWPEAPPPFTEAELPQAVLYQPSSSLEQMSVTWYLPGVENRTRTKPLGLIGFLLGQEAEGSLVGLLIDKGWASGLWAGTGEDEQDMAVFEVDISLTAEGLAHWKEVLQLVHSAVRVIADGVNLPAANGSAVAFNSSNASETQTGHAWAQLQAMDDLAFRFMSAPSPSDEVSDYAMSLQLYAPDDLFTRLYVAAEYDAQEISRLVGLMVPERAVVMVGSSCLTSDVTNSSKGWSAEKWYGTLYKTLDIPAAVLSHISSPPPDDVPKADVCPKSNDAEGASNAR
jgi:insulysin